MVNQKSKHKGRRGNGTVAFSSVSGFISYIEQRVSIIGDCWEWNGSKNEKGYGKMTFRGRQFKVHRFAYSVLVGQIPDGLEIDHKCRRRACCNPDHLEAVTRLENVRRSSGTHKSHCANGHEMNSETIAVNKTTGWRFCKICLVIRRERKRKKK